MEIVTDDIPVLGQNSWRIIHSDHSEKSVVLYNETIVSNEEMPQR
jgi:hypothetical protein